MMRLLLTLVARLLEVVRRTPQTAAVERASAGLHITEKAATYADPVYCGVGIASGRRVNVFSDGTHLPVVAGAEGETPPPPPTPEPNLDGLKLALDSAKTEAQRDAQTEMLKALGFDKREDAETWVKAKRDEEAAQLSEVERKQRDAEAREKAADERERQAAEKSLHADIRGALVEAGAPKDGVADLVALINVPADADDEAIKAAVEAKKQQFPALFAQPAGGTPPAPSSIPGGQSPKPPTPADPFAAGKQRAAKVTAARVGVSQKDLIEAFTPRPSPLVPTN